MFLSVIQFFLLALVVIHLCQMSAGSTYSSVPQVVTLMWFDIARCQLEELVLATKNYQLGTNDHLTVSYKNYKMIDNSIILTLNLREFSTKLVSTLGYTVSIVHMLPAFNSTRDFQQTLLVMPLRRQSKNPM